ncbi:MAG: helix-turn-helix transcriptional regulator [Clostridiales bacterium]|nr:helix-turn-helix transcriptional regulator [Clostridiales bacterium]
MPLTIGEKIEILLKRRGMTMAELAEKTGQSRQNLSNKMARDNFSEKDATEMAKALGCTFRTEFVMDDTGDII